MKIFPEEILKPLNAISSFRGLSILGAFKVKFALLLGYASITLSKTLGLHKKIEQVIGSPRVEFIAKLAKTKYVLYTTSDGFNFIIRPNKTDYWLVDPSWEPQVRRAFQPMEGDVVIDVGAHIGTYTIRNALAVGRSGLVIALEPDPENFKLLYANIKLNKLDNVIPLPMAVYENKGLIDFCISSDPALNSLTSNSSEKCSKVIKVHAITLDQLVKVFSLKKVDWIKIDVEGAELGVLKGAENTLDIAENLIIEIWWKNFASAISILKGKGYQIKVLSYDKECTYVLARKNTFINPQ